MERAHGREAADAPPDSMCPVRRPVRQRPRRRCGAARRRAGVAGAADEAGAPPPLSARSASRNRASTSSGLTSASTGFRISISVPWAGDGTSTVTLSVSSSTRASSFATVSPTALHQRRIVARVPSSFAGTSTSAMSGMFKSRPGWSTPAKSTRYSATQPPEDSGCAGSARREQPADRAVRRGRRTPPSPRLPRSPRRNLP